MKDNLKDKNMWSFIEYSYLIFNYCFDSILLNPLISFFIVLNDSADIKIFYLLYMYGTFYTENFFRSFPFFFNLNLIENCIHRFWIRKIMLYSWYVTSITNTILKFSSYVIIIFKLNKCKKSSSFKLTIFTCWYLRKQ